MKILLNITINQNSYIDIIIIFSTFEMQKFNTLFITVKKLNYERNLGYPSIESNLLTTLIDEFPNGAAATCLSHQFIISPRCSRYCVTPILRRAVTMNNFLFSKRSEGNLVGVNPELVKVVRRALELTAVDFIVNGV